MLRRRKGRIIVTGVGKSSFIGMKLAASLTSLGHPALFLHPVEAVHGDVGVISKDDVLIAFSFSGNSSEVVRIVEYVKRQFSIPIIAITGSRRSSLAALSSTVIKLSVSDEGSPGNVAPLASTTAALVAGDLLARGLADMTPFSLEQFALNHPGGAIGLSLARVEERMRVGDRVPQVSVSALLKDAIGEIERTRSGIVGITKSGRLAGVITDGDIRRFVAKYGSIKGREASVCMTKRPKTISKDATLADALHLMETFKITALFVTAGGSVAGLIHIHDILNS